MRRSTLLILLFLNILWAGSYSATKHLMLVAPYFLVTSMRYLIATVPLVALALVRHGLSMSWRDLVRCGAMGIATFTLCPALMYKGVDMSRASDAAILTSTEPLLISIGAYFYLRERIDRRTAMGLLIAFSGALLLSEFWIGKGGIDSWGTAMILGGVFFESCYSLIGKEMLGRHPPLRLIAVALIAASLVNLTAVTGLGMWSYALRFSGTDWAVLLVYLSLLCTVVGYTFWFVALKDDTTSRVAVTIYTQPVLGVIIAWMWLGEIPTFYQVVGAAIILFGVTAAVVSRSKIRRLS